jgi:hypothetical protein
MTQNHPETSTLSSIDTIKTVRIGKFAYCQGTLVWEHGNLACVRSFSKEFVGTLV